MEPLQILILSTASFIAGLYGTLVGGGALLTIPLLIILGLPVHNAIATNRLGMLGIVLAGFIKFREKKLINYQLGLKVGLAAMAGALIGSNLMLAVDPAILKNLVVVITLIVLTILVARPGLGEKHVSNISGRRKRFGVALGFFVGVYAGFYSGGTGTFYSYLLILVFGQTFLESAGTRKIMSFLTAAASALVFIFRKAVFYDFAAVIFLSAFIGSYIGAHYSQRIGNRNIKRLFIIIVLALTLKLMFT